MPGGRSMVMCLQCVCEVWNSKDSEGQLPYCPRPRADNSCDLGILSIAKLVFFVKVVEA